MTAHWRGAYIGGAGSGLAIGVGITQLAPDPIPLSVQLIGLVMLLWSLNGIYGGAR